MKILHLFACIGGFCVLAPAQAQQIVLRHNLDARNAQVLDTLVQRFNATQKGKAGVTLEAAKNVADKHQLPALALLDTDDDINFFGTLPRFRPVHQVMKEAGTRLETATMYPLILDAASDKPGQLNALPIGLSMPVLYWNKEAFRKAGLDPDVPPRTWRQVQDTAGALLDAGVACPLTSSHFSWVHLENVTTQQGQPIFGQSNRVALNGLINVKHLAMLATWYRSSYFRYYGAHSEGDARFLSGECAMLTSDSSLYADIHAEGRIQAGVAGLPYYDDEYGFQPGNTVPDGASLYVLAGRKKDDYKVAARFIAFLMQRDAQLEWVRGTGYLPMTSAALAGLRDGGVPDTVLNPLSRRLAMRGDKARLKSGVLLTRVRRSVDEQVQLLWSDKVSAKQALDTAMLRANTASGN